MVTANFIERVGSAVKRAAMSEQSIWHTPLMAAASGAVAERIPLVDIVLDIRDARAPLSSDCELLSSFPRSHRVIILNKIHAVDKSHVEEWVNYFREQRYPVRCANIDQPKLTHQLLSYLRTIASAYAVHERSTITIMLVGIPNVGKSALANALHLLGRVSAEEKGRLQHSYVSAVPGKTTTITSMKIASHPSVYILDTPSILPPQIPDIKTCANLALTGAFKDNLIGRKLIAQCAMALFNSSDQYMKWVKPVTSEKKIGLPRPLYLKPLALKMKSEIIDKKRKDSRNMRDMNEVRLAPRIRVDVEREDHRFNHMTRDMISAARGRLADAIASFEGSLEKEEDMLELIKMQMESLADLYCLSEESGRDVEDIVALKLLDVYRFGTLGKYTLDDLPSPCSF